MSPHTRSTVSQSIGAAVTPEMDPPGPMLAKFEAKVNAGAKFFQTQAIYHADQFNSFMQKVRPFKVKVLAGILLLRSAKMAEFLNANIPGIAVPADTTAIASATSTGSKSTARPGAPQVATAGNVGGSSSG